MQNKWLKYKVTNSCAGYKEQSVSCVVVISHADRFKFKNSWGLYLGWNRLPTHECTNTTKWHNQALWLLNVMQLKQSPSQEMFWHAPATTCVATSSILCIPPIELESNQTYNSGSLWGKL